MGTSEDCRAQLRKPILPIYVRHRKHRLFIVIGSDFLPVSDGHERRREILANSRVRPSPTGCRSAAFMYT